MLATNGPGNRLGLIKTRDMRRYEEMEIKQGRIAMLATLHVIVTEAGIRRPAPGNHPDSGNPKQTLPETSSNRAAGVSLVCVLRRERVL